MIDSSVGWIEDHFAPPRYQLIFIYLFDRKALSREPVRSEFLKAFGNVDDSWTLLTNDESPKEVGQAEALAAAEVEVDDADLTVPHCCVCLGAYGDNPISFIPCGHAICSRVSCAPVGQVGKLCPICKSPIKGLHQVHL